MPEGRIVGAYLVPGLPHLLFDEGAGSWSALRQALRKAGRSAREARPDVLVIFSSQWISVLGHLFQAHPNPRGVHVDENWHYLGDVPFDFRVDVELAKKAATTAESMGLQARPVAYDGFPIDTGTLVSLKFFNWDGAVAVVCVSCNIYAGRDEELTLGRATAAAIRQLGRRAALIACTGLSGHFFTHDIAASEDRISSEDDDRWNRRLLELIAQGKARKVADLIPQYTQQAAADMMFKAFYWLMGAVENWDAKGKVLSYGPLWGTGAAVIDYELQA